MVSRGAAGGSGDVRQPANGSRTLMTAAGADCWAWADAGCGVAGGDQAGGAGRGASSTGAAFDTAIEPTGAGSIELTPVVLVEPTGGEPVEPACGELVEATGGELVEAACGELVEADASEATCCEAAGRHGGAVSIAGDGCQAGATGGCRACGGDEGLGRCSWAGAGR